MKDFCFEAVPIAVSWDITKKCNLKCAHCYSNSSLIESEELNTEESKKLIAEIRDMDIEQLIILGGEPFCRPDLFELLEYAVRKGLSIALTTNGYYINKNIAFQLAAFNLDGVQISLDSSNCKQHNSFRGQDGGFEKAVEALKILSTCGVYTIVNTVLSKDNIDQLEDIILLCISLKVKRFRFIKYIPSGRGITNFKRYAINKIQNEHLQRKIKILKDRYKNYIEISQDESMAFLQGENTLFCTAGISTLSVMANGDVIPCSYLNDEKFICGNVKYTSLYKIWNGSKIRNFRDLDNINKKCKICKYLSICKGGCKAAAYGLYGSCNAIDPYCFLK